MSPREKYSFLNAAEKVLVAADAPLNPSEIVARAIALGLVESTGKTPVQTMKSKLSTDILRRRDQSRFMRTDKNLFGLRKWTDRYPEYVADRYQKALLDEEVMVFPSTLIDKIIPKPGLLHLTIDDANELVRASFPMQRREAEQDFSVIQLVSAFVVRANGRIATYKRTRRLPEARLHGVFSLLFGGHLNPDDVPPLFSVFDPAVGPMFIRRELSEELKFSEDPSLTLVGAVYDPRREVSRQHLGVLYDVVVDPSTTITVGERGFLQQLRFETPAEIEGRIDDFENWSELVLREHIL